MELPKTRETRLAVALYITLKAGGGVSRNSKLGNETDINATKRLYKVEAKT
jgi:hypothetical protein